MSIKLQFIASSDIPSQLIQYFGGGQVSHVDYVTKDGLYLGSRGDEVGGKPSGVQLRPKGYKSISRAFIVELNTDRTDLEGKFDSAIRTQIGKPYDYEAIAGFALGRDWRNRDTWFCSELIGAMLEQVTWLPLLVTPSNKLTPEDLLIGLSSRRDARITQEDGWTI